MSIGNWISGLSGLAGGISGIASAYGDYQLGKENLGHQQDVFEWQQGAQQEAWKREDNAVQRRVADLEAAGLNKVLAAGQGAASSGPIKPTVPQRSSNAGTAMSKGLNTLVNALVSSQNIAQTIAQTDLIKENVKYESMLNKWRSDTPFGPTLGSNLEILETEKRRRAGYESDSAQADRDYKRNTLDDRVQQMEMLTESKRLDLEKLGLSLEQYKKLPPNVKTILQLIQPLLSAAIR